MPASVPAITVPDGLVIRAYTLDCPTGRPELTSVHLAPWSDDRNTLPTNTPAPAYRLVPPPPLAPEARAPIETLPMPLLIELQLAPLSVERKTPALVPVRRS